MTDASSVSYFLGIEDSGNCEQMVFVTEVVSFADVSITELCFVILYESEDMLYEKIVLLNCFSKLQLMTVKCLDQSQAVHSEIKHFLDQLSLY